MRIGDTIKINLIGYDGYYTFMGRFYEDEFTRSTRILATKGNPSCFWECYWFAEKDVACE